MLVIGYFLIPFLHFNYAQYKGSPIDEIRDKKCAPTLPLPWVSQWWGRADDWWGRPDYRMSLVLQNAILPFLRHTHPNPRPLSHLHLNPQFFSREFLAAFFRTFFRHPVCLAWWLRLDIGQKENILFKLWEINQASKGNFKHKLEGSLTQNCGAPLVTIGMEIVGDVVGRVT